MTLETWLAFSAAAAILLLIPGPTVLLVIAYAVSQGRRVAFPVAAGVALGDLAAMTVSILGLGALLAASATLFTLLRWLGALYLIGLGIRLWRAGEQTRALPAPGRAPAARMLVHACVVTALNPKSITFFVAFLPQFLDPRAPWLGQVLVLETTFLALAAANAFGYALLAGRARHRFSQPRTLRRLHRAGGALLIGTGIATLDWSRRT